MNRGQWKVAGYYGLGALALTAAVVIGSVLGGVIARKQEAAYAAEYNERAAAYLKALYAVAKIDNETASLAANNLALMQSTLRNNKDLTASPSFETGREAAVRSTKGREHPDRDKVQLVVDVARAGGSSWEACQALSDPESTSALEPEVRNKWSMATCELIPEHLKAVRKLFPDVFVGRATLAITPR
jgi:hypothetical protein